MGELKNDSPEEKKKSEKNGSIPMRTYVIMILAGAYVAYLGFSLCQGVIKGEEGSSVGFLAAGIIFIVLGAVFLIRGIKGSLKLSKEKQAEEAEAEQQISETKNRENDSLDSKMSIADRANLVSQLGDAPEDEE